MENEILYNITCRSCGKRYETYIKPVVGLPCPNPQCPHGNPLLANVWWQRKIVKIVTVAGGIGIGGALLFNIGGWGTFALEVGITLLFQIAIALVILGALLVICFIALKDIFKSIISNRFIFSGLILLALVLTIPLIPYFRNRPADQYDWIQAVGFGLVTNLFYEPIKNRLERKRAF